MGSPQPQLSVFEQALRVWCARREGVPRVMVQAAEIVYDHGFSSDVTYEPDSFSVQYEVSGGYRRVPEHRAAYIEKPDIGSFIGEVAELAAALGASAVGSAQPETPDAQAGLGVQDG